MRLVCALWFVVGVLACNETCPEQDAPPPLSSYALDCVVDTDCAVTDLPSCGTCECSVQEQTICCDTVESDVVSCSCTATFAVCDEGSCAVAFCDAPPFIGDRRCDL